MPVKHAKSFVATVVALAAGAALYRLFMPDPYAWIHDRLPISVPYDFATATSTRRVDFQVLPGDHVPAGYVVGFDVDRQGAFDPVRHKQGHDVPLNVVVERISAKGATRIDSFGTYQIGCMNSDKPCSSEQHKEVGEGITRTYMAGHTSATVEIIAANFWINDYGQYRATIRFPKEVPDLGELDTRLVVREKQRAR